MGFEVLLRVRLGDGVVNSGFNLRWSLDDYATSTVDSSLGASVAIIVSHDAILSPGNATGTIIMNSLNFRDSSNINR